jgi:phosphoribosylanthranilate isomerase
VTAIKICGLRTLEDCLVSTSAGATMLGFNFWTGSKRYVSPEGAADLCESIGSDVTRVGLFVDADPSWVQHVLSTVKLDMLQFHGDEDPLYCRRFNHPFMKAFRLRNPNTITHIPDYLDSPEDVFLVDAYVPGEKGGTGAPFDLALANQARQTNGRMILAGGLNSTNVGSAIQAVKPWGVDTASGVEDSPGIKNPDAIRAFAHAVQEVDNA